MAVVKIALIDDKNRVLLNLRGKEDTNAGKWALFGGSVEEGESADEAIIREIKEEIDYNLIDFELIKTGKDQMGERFWYRANIEKQTYELCLNEGEDMKFFTYDEIKNINTTNNTKMILDFIFNS